MQTGFYRMNFRGMSLGECWRFSREPFKFLICLVLKISGKEGEKVILPPHENEREIVWADLSDDARHHLESPMSEATKLGYRRVRWVVQKQSFINTIKESFGCHALHDDGRKVLFVAYIASSASGEMKKKVTVVGILPKKDSRRELFTTEEKYFDCPYLRTRVVSPGTVEQIDAIMQKRVDAADDGEFAAFDTLPGLTDHLNAANVASFDDKIRRGLYVWLGTGTPD